jgi:hypothetical protein
LALPTCPVRFVQAAGLVADAAPQKMEVLLRFWHDSYVMKMMQ